MNAQEGSPRIAPVSGWPFIPPTKTAVAEPDGIRAEVSPWYASPWLRGSALGVLVGVLVNLVIVLTGVGEDAPDAADPGPINGIIYAIVPFVWVALFAAIGTAIMLLRDRGSDARVATWAAVLLLANCALYPVYTLGFTSMSLGLAGNIFTAVLAAFGAGASYRLVPPASALLLPVILWVSLASLGLVAVMTGGSF